MQKRSKCNSERKEGGEGGRGEATARAKRNQDRRSEDEEELFRTVRRTVELMIMCSKALTRVRVLIMKMC